MNWLRVLKTFGPVIIAIIPGAAPFAPIIIAAMELAEETGKPGAEKKEIAKKAIKVSAEAANIIAGKELIKLEEITQVADNTIDAVIKATNIISEINKVKDVDKK